MNERRAIDLCIKHRDPIGFEFLVCKYRREALFHAYALLGDRDDAAEACQESFASAFASLPLLTELTSFYPWFYRVLRNRCLNLLDRRRTATAYRQAECEREPASADGPDVALDRAQRAAEVIATLAMLPFEFREILALKYMRDFDYAELAALLGIPRGTVMSRLHRARKAFQDVYRRRGAHDKTAAGAPYGEESHG